jgi:HAMP domain-containing protein
MATMTDAQQIAASWRTEALQTLLWAVGIVPEMLPYDVPAGETPLKQFLGADLDRALAVSQLRPTDQLERARSTAELWHWRARTRQLIDRGETFPQSPQTAKAGIRTFDDVVRVTAKLAVEHGTIPTQIDSDFPICGKAYRDASSDEFSLAHSITMERHFALNWLCGFAPGGRWDETPTDT